jgi:hypothetical protein
MPKSITHRFAFENTSHKANADLDAASSCAAPVSAWQRIALTD